MDAGKMRYQLTWQSPPGAGARDNYGQPVGDWVDVATVWASLSPLNGRRFYEALQSQSSVTHEIYTRYRTGVTTAMRLRLGSGDRARYFRPVSIIDPDERHEMLKIMAEELVK